MEVVSEVKSGVVWLRWWWWGCVSANTRWDAELGAKSDKSERNGSIWGAPCQTAVEGDGGWWWDEVDEVVVVVWLCVRKREAGEGAGAESDESERDGSIWATPCQTVVEGDGGMWCGCAVEVVVVEGLRGRETFGAGQLGAKFHESKRDGSIRGALCQPAVEGDGGMWCGCAVEVVVVGLRVHKT
jgi:hypothetical protein